MNFSLVYRHALRGGFPASEAPDVLPADARKQSPGGHKGVRTRRVARLLAAGSVLGSILLSGSAHAQQVAVTPTVTANGSFFNYSYSVFNGAPANLVFVAFQTPLLERDAATNLAAPAGFGTHFDSGDGFISFAPDDPNSPNPQQRFAPGSIVAPFTFDSPFAPLAVSFMAFDVNGIQYIGTTLAPGGAAAVPEASTAVPFSALLALGGFAILRRKSAKVGRLQESLDLKGKTL